MEKIVVSGTRLVGQTTGNEFIAWGTNFGGISLSGDVPVLIGATQSQFSTNFAPIHDVWVSNDPNYGWPYLMEQLDIMARFGLNAIRLTMGLGAMLNSPTQADKTQLYYLDKFITECGKRGIRLDITGVGIEDIFLYSWRQPNWLLTASESTYWTALATWWSAVAGVCVGRPEILFYDLVNEPFVAPSTATLQTGFDNVSTADIVLTASSPFLDLNNGGGVVQIGSEYIGFIFNNGANLQHITRGMFGTTRASHTAGDKVIAGYWHVGANAGSGGEAFNQYFVRDANGRTSLSIAQSWIANVTNAIRAVDAVTPISLGAYSGLNNPSNPLYWSQSLSGLDLYCMHIYPDEGTSWETLQNDWSPTNTGKPLIIEETYPLIGGANDTGYRYFLAESLNQANGYFTQWTLGTDYIGSQANNSADFGTVFAKINLNAYDQMRSFATENPPGASLLPDSDVKNQWQGTNFLTINKNLQTNYDSSLNNTLRYPGAATLPTRFVNGFGANTSKQLAIDCTTVRLNPGDVCTGATFYHLAQIDYEKIRLDCNADGKNQWTINGGQATAWQTLSFGTFDRNSISNAASLFGTIDAAKNLTPNADAQVVNVLMSTFTLGSRTVKDVTLWLYFGGGVAFDSSARYATPPDEFISIKLLTDGGLTTLGAWTLGSSQREGWYGFTYTGSITQTQIDGLTLEVKDNLLALFPSSFYRAYIEVGLVPDSTVVYSAEISNGSSPFTPRASVDYTADQNLAWRSVSVNQNLSQSVINNLRLNFNIPGSCHTLYPGVQLYSGFVKLNISRAQGVSPNAISSNDLVGIPAIGSQNQFIALEGIS